MRHALIAVAVLSTVPAGQPALACDPPHINPLPSRIGGKEVELRWEGTAASYQLQFEVRTPDGAVLQSEQILTAEKSFKLRPRPAAAGAKVSIELLARCAGAISSEPVRTTWFVPGSTWCSPVTGLRVEPGAHLLRWDKDSSANFRVYIQDPGGKWTGPTDTAQAEFKLTRQIGRPVRTSVSRRCGGGESQPVILILR